MGKCGRTSCGGHRGRERQVCAYGRTCRPFRRPDGSGRENGAGRRCRRRTGGFVNGAVARAERMSLGSRARRIAGIVLVTSRLGKMGRRPGTVRRRSLRFFRRRRFHRRGVANGRRQVFVSVEGGAGCSVRAGRLFTGWLRRRIFCNGLIDNGVNAGGRSGPRAGRPGRPDSGERKRGSVGQGGYPPADGSDVLAFRENCSNFPRSPRCPPDGDPFGMRLSGSEVGGSDLYT